MNRACFEWRSPPAPPPSRLDQLTLGMMRLAYVIYGALLAGMVAIVIVIAHMRWREEWWLAPLLALLLIWGLMVWRCMRQSADGRLWLDEQTLRVETGLPRQAAWLGLSTSWSVSLDDLRSGKAQWRWNEVISSSAAAPPLAFLRVRTPSGWQRLTLEVWQPAGRPTPALQTGSPSNGLTDWSSPNRLRQWQAHLQALPLTQALAARGVALPPLQDLLRHAAPEQLLDSPRTRCLAAASALLLASGAPLLPAALAPHTLIWPAGSWSGTALFALALAVTGPPAFIWLLCEPQNSDRGAWLFRLRFRAWQCLWALTTGGMLALCGWVALILLTSWLAAMQPVTVTIAVQPASGLRQLQAAVPGGPLKLWEESASALPCAAGQAFLLPMQRGPAGLWWQFRRQELRQRMQALPCRETAPASAPAAAYPIATLAAARDWR